MSNQFVIFSAQDEDADSALFSVSPREGVGISDTDYSAYFEIFGSLGGGTLTLQKKCIDGNFKEVENLTSSFNADLPSSGKCALISMNFKDPTGIFKFNLAGSTTPELTITGINMQGAA